MKNFILKAKTLFFKTIKTHKMTSEDKKNTSIILILSWVVVGIPLIWGITQTFYKALALFK
jgi:hypothetical protein